MLAIVLLSLSTAFSNRQTKHLLFLYYKTIKDISHKPISERNSCQDRFTRLLGTIKWMARDACMPNPGVCRASYASFHLPH